MHFRIIIQRLSTIIPSWRRTIKTTETATFATLRWRIEQETALEDAEMVGFLIGRLQALHDESAALIAELRHLHAEALAWRRVPLAELKRRTRNFSSGWKPWVESQGYVFNSAKQAWFKRTEDVTTVTA